MGTGSYFEKALTRTNADLIGDMRMNLHGTRYDTIIGTGLSGTIFAARVAPGLSKKFAIVRKDKDGSHSGIKVEGLVGRRWVFADDFVSTGRTLRRVLERMQEYHPTAEFMGLYQYEYGSFYTAKRAAEKWGSWVRDLALGPEYGPLTRTEYALKHPYRTIELQAPRAGWDPRVLPLVPLPDWSQIEFEGLTWEGEPRFYDRKNYVTFLGTDPRAAELSRVVQGYQGGGDALSRLIGTRMDRFPRRFRTPPKDWTKAVPTRALDEFTESVIQADEAVSRMILWGKNGAA